MIKTLNIILAIVIIIGINLVSYQAFTRFDFTEGQVYTLSQSTKALTKNLSSTLKVKVFLSENLPAQVAKVKQDLNDYLDEYAALSDGKLEITFTDPAKDEKAKALTKPLGIPALELQVLQKDQRQTIKAYMGLAIIKEKEDYEPSEDDDPAEKFEKFETIPVLTSLENFEYDFTSALKKVSSTEEKTIGFLRGHEEHEIIPQYIRRNPFMKQEERMDYDLDKVLGKNYQIKTVQAHPTKNESSTTLDLKGIDTLVIAGPKTPITETEVETIKTFVKEGGNAVFLIDQIDIGEGMQTSKLESDYANLLNHWGVAVDAAFVQDASHAHSSFQKGFFSFTLPYPFWPKVRHLNETNAITAQLESFVLPWTSPLKIKEKEDVTIEILASSSPRYSLAMAEIEVEIPKTEETETPPTEEETAPLESSESEAETEAVPETVLQERPIDLDPQQNFGISHTKKDPLPLAVIAKRTEDAGKVFITGDSDFIKQDFMRQYPENITFFSNVIDAFTIGEELISIRSRGITDRPIVSLSESQKNLIRWGNILLIPFLVILFGLIRKALRNARKKSI